MTVIKNPPKLCHIYMIPSFIYSKPAWSCSSGDYSLQKTVIVPCFHRLLVF